jgi:hypothetical protein
VQRPDPGLIPISSGYLKIGDYTSPEGVERAVIGVVGDHINEDIRSRLKELPGVEALVRITRSYKLDSREFHPIDTVVNKKGVKIGGGNAPVVISRPCSVESEEQFMPIVIAVKAAGTDGLLIEVHSNPDQTMSDGPQSVIFEPFLHSIDGVRSVTGAGSDNSVPLHTQPVGV